MPLPDSEARKALIEGKLQKDVRSDLTEEQWATLLSLTEGYSCADLQFIVKEAAMAPIREMPTEALMTMKDTLAIRPITLADFEKVLKENQPSVS